jgi:hypothetical protein
MRGLKKKHVNGFGKTETQKRPEKTLNFFSGWQVKVSCKEPLHKAWMMAVFSNVLRHKNKQ